MSQPLGTPPPPGAQGGDKTLMLILAYLFPLSLIPLLTDKDDANVQWHAKNGVCIGLAVFAIGLACVVVSFIPILGCVVVPVYMVLCLGALVVTILAIVKALNGQRFIVPGVSQFVDKINL
jgi:uncharacterized membrane protein